MQFITSHIAVFTGLYRNFVLILFYVSISHADLHVAVLGTVYLRVNTISVFNFCDLRSSLILSSLMLSSLLLACSFALLGGTSYVSNGMQGVLSLSGHWDLYINNYLDVGFY